jgi:hypothetical protein
MGAVRDRAKLFLDKVPAAGVASNGDTVLFEQLTNVTQTTLEEDWKKGGFLTACNGFTGAFGTWIGVNFLGKPGLGVFDVEGQLKKYGLGAAWVPANSKAGFKLSEASIASLRTDGVPETVLSTLAGLKDKDLGLDEFLKEMDKDLDQVQSLKPTSKPMSKAWFNEQKKLKDLKEKIRVEITNSADTNRLPQLGDVFVCKELPYPGQAFKDIHVGVSYSVNGAVWTTVEAGQGGKSLGHDLILKKTSRSLASILGWADIEELMKLATQPKTT